MAAEEGDLEQALVHFRAANESCGGTGRMGADRQTLRLLGKADEARSTGAAIMNADPLNPFVGWEMKLLGDGAPEKLYRDDAQTWLEVALAYSSLGLLETSCAILEAAWEVTDHAMLHYYRGWFLHRLGRDLEARDEFMRAASSPTTYVFPHRIEAEAALRTAMKEAPHDAAAPYYLGTLLFMLGRGDEGRDLWEQAAQMDCPDASLYYCLGWAAWKLDGDLQEATHQYRRALALRPDDHRMRLDFDAIRKERGVSAEERLDALLSLPEEVRAKGRIPALLVSLHTEVGDLDEAVRLLTENSFHPWEGEVGMRRVYVDAWMGLGDSRSEERDDAGAYEAYVRWSRVPAERRRRQAIPGRMTRRLCYRAGLAAEKLGRNEGRAVALAGRRLRGASPADLGGSLLRRDVPPEAGRQAEGRREPARHARGARRTGRVRQGEREAHGARGGGSRVSGTESRQARPVDTLRQGGYILLSVTENACLPERRGV